MSYISIVSIAYLLNSFLPTILMFLYFFFGDYNKAANIALISSFAIMIFQIFSSNKRNIILSNSNNKLILQTLLFRTYFLIPLFISYVLFLNLNEKLNFGNFVFFFLFSSLWINELLISHDEINNSKKSLTYFISLTIVLLISFIFDEKLKLELFFIIVLSYIIFLFVPKIIFLFKKKQLIAKIYLSDLKKSLYENILSITFLSSFSFILSVFVWRYYMLKILPENVAIYYFLIFAIASFPGTFLNNYFGITILRQKEIKIVRILFAYSLVIIAIIATYLLIDNNFLIFEKYKEEMPVFSKLFFSSMLGSILMLPAMFLRTKLIYFREKNNTTIFIFDVIYGILMALTVPIIGSYFFDYLYLSFFVGSLISIWYYFLAYNKIFKKKINE